jgi:hypothetical protein
MQNGLGMKVIGIFNIKKRGTVISGVSPYRDNVSHKNGDILSCGDKSWKVIAVDRFHQGCFGVPKERYHGLKLEPIDHDSQPNVGDELV